MPSSAAEDVLSGLSCRTTLFKSENRDALTNWRHDTKYTTRIADSTAVWNTTGDDWALFIASEYVRVGKSDHVIKPFLASQFRHDKPDESSCWAEQQAAATATTKRQECYQSSES